MTQMKLDFTRPDPPPHSPRRRPDPGTQCGRILERLEKWPATSLELSRVTIKYTQRISDLRAMGYRIKGVEHRDRGYWVYTLIS